MQWATWDPALTTTLGAGPSHSSAGGQLPSGSTSLCRQGCPWLWAPLGWVALLSVTLLFLFLMTQRQKVIVGKGVKLAFWKCKIFISITKC